MKLQIKIFFVFLYCSGLLWIHDVTAKVLFDNVTDQMALMQLKKSVVNDPNGVFNSWNMSLHFCSWLGVTCSTRHSDRVTALNLEGRNLRGTIPPHIGNLTFLRLINLVNNSFSGEIPRQVGRLRRLEHLKLANNTLVGEIPSLINCSELRTVDLMGNELVGVIPPELGFLPKIVYIQVSANNLKGGIPLSLGNASTLRAFSAGRNDLEGNIPDVMGGLKLLEFFSVTVNQLSGIVPPSLYNRSSMKIMVLAVNNLSGTLPLNIGTNLPNLEKLGLAGNSLSGHIPASLSNASQLQVLDFGSNYFEGQIPKSLGNLSNLWWLDLSENRLGTNSSDDSDVLAHLAKCRKMVMLSLVHNNFGGTLLDSMGNFSNHLSYLFLGGNNIHGHLPFALENLSNLLSLGVERNALTGKIPNYFGKFSRMQILSLRENRLSGSIPSSLGELTRLFKLDLSQNNIEGKIPPSIGSAQNLQRIDFSRNKLSGEIPRLFFSLSQSTLLNLSHNNLSGSVPGEVGNLKQLNVLDLSANNLSGEIPKAIGDCSVLESLHLQGNSFDKNIPSSLDSLKGLVNLDLSENNLSGEIPRELLKLPFLLYLNLSFNDLEGEVPSTGVFRNTSAVSVIENSRLCGGVIELHLPPCPIKESDAGMSQMKKLIIIIVSVAAALSILSLLLYLRKSRRKSPSTQSEPISSLPKVSYQTLHRATNGFSLSNLIGAGSFGTVYKGVLEQEQNEVAIKVLNIQATGAFKSFIAECNALKTIRHRNLVKILTCCSSLDHKGNDFKALVFDYMPNGSLDRWLHPENDEQNPPRILNLIERLDIAIDVSCALSYLHDHCEQPIIHCDLKPSNILLNNEMAACINDFGLARLISSTTNLSKSQTSMSAIKGTIGYVAPEYAMSGEPSSHGDVYSYGILVLEMFTGRRPIDDIFAENLNLHNFVKIALPEKLEEIVDPTLLQQTNNGGGEIYETEIEMENINHQERNQNPTSTKLRKCLVSVLNIGLACSVDSPKERMNMDDVTKELQHIKKCLYR